MFSINNGKIYITRGDSAYITISVVDAEGNAFALDNSVALRGQVRSILNDDENLGFLFDADITINEDDGTATWHIKPSDTATAVMGIPYYYDIELHIGEDVYTIISSTLNIRDEVTLPEGV